MKRILILFFIFSSILSFSQDYFKNGYGEKRHSIGVFVSPVALTTWYTGYQIIPDQQSSGYRIGFTFFSPSGIGYQYALNNAAKIQIGVFTTIENRNFEKLHTGSLLKNVEYKVDYLNIPLSVRLFPAHFGESKTLGGFFIQAGLNCDFVTKEHIVSTTHSPHDNHFSIPLGYVDLNYKLEESNSAKIKFNRVCPTLEIGQEVVGDKITFFYGGYLQLASMYQKHNTLEYFRNSKISLINFGVNYRF